MIKKTSTNHITNWYWDSSSACLTKVMARAMAMFLAWEVVKARQISRTKEHNLDNSDYRGTLSVFFM